MFQRLKRHERGQTMVEFALVLVLALALTSILNFQMKRHIKRVWFGLAKTIAAPCQDCTVPEAISSRL